MSFVHHLLSLSLTKSSHFTYLLIQLRCLLINFIYLLIYSTFSLLFSLFAHTFYINSTQYSYLLTFELACSFFHIFRSIWYKSLPSLCHELSNDMLDCILFFIVSFNSTKKYSAAFAWKLLARTLKFCHHKGFFFD